MRLSGGRRLHGGSNTARGRPSKSLKVGLLVLVGMIALLYGSPPASAVQSPPGCTNNDYVLNLGKSVTVAHVGDTITYTVGTGNPNTSGSACDVTINSVVGTRPDNTTASLGAPCTGAFAAGTPVNNNCGTFTYVVAAADVVGGSVTAQVTSIGCLHDTNSATDPPCAPDDNLNITKAVTVTVLIPSISVTKQCTNSTGPSQPIAFNGTVHNTGNTLLTVVCTDSPSGQTVFNGPLNAGASAPYSGSYVPASSPSTDTVTCIGTDVSGQTVQAQASATCSVCNPSIQVQKVCNSANGNPIQFAGTVTNNGGVSLTGLTCSDRVNGGSATPVTPSSTSLSPGASATYSGSFTGIIPGTSIDVVTCIATVPASCGGGTVTDSAAASCDLGILSTQQNPVTAHPGDLLKDSATINGVPSGTVTFQLFGPSDQSCSGTPIHTETVPITAPGGTVTTPVGFVATVVGVYHWTVTYVGGGLTIVDACTEPVQVAEVPVPTLSEWGTVVMVVLLVGVALLRLRRRPRLVV